MIYVIIKEISDFPHRKRNVMASTDRKKFEKYKIALENKEKDRIKANIPPCGIEQYYSIDTLETI